MKQIMTFSVDGYRSLSGIRLDDMKRVNLFVGRNGVGKSSLLEALYLYFTRGTIESVVSIAKRRGEYDLADDNRTWVPSMRHMFAGHIVLPEKSKITLETEKVSVNFGLNVRQLPKKDDYRIVQPTLSCSVTTHKQDVDGSLEFPVSKKGGIDVSYDGDGGYNKALSPEDIPVVFIDPEGVDPLAMLRMRDQVVAEGEEALLVEALRMLDSSVESVGFLSPAEKSYTSLVNGTLVGLVGQKGRVPVKTLGDGMRRLMTMAMGMVCARGGALIVDEIDAGIHYSAMDSLWGFVCTAAKRYDVQVFASTHSQDCLRGLGSCCREDIGLDDVVRLFAIGGKHRKVVAYAGNEISVSMDRGIEVRT